MKFRFFIIVIGVVVLTTAIVLSMGCQNQPTGPEVITKMEAGNPPVSGKTRGTIVVRARGTGGSEHINLKVGGSTVASWTLSTSYQDYSASSNNTGNIEVCFDNDGSNKDVQVDYITVNGSTRQAENQSSNTGVWQNSQCGGSNSEYLHCNGCINFGNNSNGSSTTTSGGSSTTTSGGWWWSSTTTSGGSSTTTTSGGTTTTTSGGGSNSIVVRARGTNGDEHINLKVSGSTIANWTLSTSYSNYSASTNNTGSIEVAFDNDGTNKDVQVDYITVNGSTRQAENQSTNTGVWQNSQCGGSNSEWLHCNGYIGFGNVSGGGTTTTTTTSGGTTTTTTSGGTSGSVYLCFDDGPSGNSSSLCNSLKNAGCNAATFFVIGQNMPGNSSAYKSAGFSVQNHSQTHSHMTSWGYQQVYNDLQQCSQAIQNAGFPKPTRIRLPYLESNSTIQSACSDLGLSIVSPTVDTRDWNGASTSQIVSACNSLNAGGNPLMHETQGNTLSAISQIVQNLKNRGLGFAQY
jgi:peptidoglycan/xylan/chitin deacetylase (PgdA/CDA1 family)